MGLLVKTCQVSNRRNHMKFKDKVAIITGATKGIGEACAYEFAKEGAKVVVTGRSVDLGEKVVADIKTNGGDAFFVRCDIGQKESNG